MPHRAKLIVLAVVGGALLTAALAWAGLAPRGDAHASHPGDFDMGAPPDDADVAMSQSKNHPLELRVTVGETITWYNGDTYPHTVTSDTGLFDSGLMDGGATWSWTFDAPGTYRYHCEPHSWSGPDARLGQTGVVIVG